MFEYLAPTNEQEPLIARCHTKPVEWSKSPDKLRFSVCLVMNRQCRYILAFGTGYLCKHPDHLEFRRTEHVANSAESFG